LEELGQASEEVEELDLVLEAEQPPARYYSLQQAHLMHSEMAKEASEPQHFQPPASAAPSQWPEQLDPDPAE